MRRTRAAVARPLHDVAERDARLRLARPPARGGRPQSYKNSSEAR